MVAVALVITRTFHELSPRRRAAERFVNQPLPPAFAGLIRHCQGTQGYALMRSTPGFTLLPAFAG